MDFSMGNLRDIMRHVKKERVKQQSILAVNFSDRIFGEKSADETSAENRPYNRLSEEEKAFQAQAIEREHLMFENNKLKL
jgi:hypothetical protein